MLDEDPANVTAVINALRAWHTNNTPPPAGLGITAVAADIWEIDYGLGGVPIGTIRMSQSNFQVTHATDAGGNFVAFGYNHVWPGVLNYATLAAALACNDLPNNHGFRALIIMMCSEAARSKLVERFVRSVLNGGADADAYATVRGLTAQYGHTQIHTGGQVANGPGWAPLETHHHLNYALHQRDVLKVVNLFEGIHGVNSFANQHM